MDYIRELHESLEKPNRKVSEVMTSDVVTIAPDAILGHASRLMVDQHLNDCRRSRLWVSWLESLAERK